ncbi:MAG: histidine phosphatase family protein [Alphaproteobacteria bacterium]|nr:histidine phosphatase family protein [Alphaproteobacteria bacterium]
MPTLHLLRHVKSSWADDGIDDFDRPLAPRGERAAGVIAAYLKQGGISPDLILCSAARRTRDTLNAVRSGLPKGVPVEMTRALYEVGPDRILALVRDVDPQVRILMLVGHNPGLEGLALYLAGKGSDRDARAALERKFPTGAFASLDYDGTWPDLTAGCARLTRLVTPKELV